MTLIIEGVVQGPPTTISGNWVDVSGATVIAKVSGEVVKISGESVFVYISGGILHADISGETVIAKISGETVVAEISGETVVAEISGQTVVAKISGQTVVTEISGQVVYVSGQTVVAKISGQTVVTEISGQTVVAKISGETVVVLESLSTAFAWQSGTGATAVANTYTATRPVYLDRVDYNAANFTSTASTLYVYHGTADALTSSVLVAVNMVVGSPKNIIWLPDTNPYIVLSGDAIKTVFTNPNNIAFYTRTVVSWR